MKKKKAMIKQVIIKEVDLRLLCEQSGLTLTALADKSGISLEYISKMVNGHLYISEEKWKAMSKHFKTLK